MIVRKSRTAKLRWGTVFQLLQYNFNCLFQLRVAALTYKGRILFLLEIRWYAAVLDLPLAREGIVDTGTRRAQKTAIHQTRPARHADEPTPGSCSDEFANPRPLEVPRHRVAARARALINDHDLGAEDSLGLDQWISHAI